MTSSDNPSPGLDAVAIGKFFAANGGRAVDLPSAVEELRAASAAVREVAREVQPVLSDLSNEGKKLDRTAAKLDKVGSEAAYRVREAASVAKDELARLLDEGRSELRGADEVIRAAVEESATELRRVGQHVQVNLEARLSDAVAGLEQALRDSEEQLRRLSHEAASAVTTASAAATGDLTTTLAQASDELNIAARAAAESSRASLEATSAGHRAAGELRDALQDSAAAAAHGVELLAESREAIDAATESATTLQEVVKQQQRAARSTDKTARDLDRARVAFEESLQSTPAWVDFLRANLETSLADAITQATAESRTTLATMGKPLGEVVSAIRGIGERLAILDDKLEEAANRAATEHVARQWPITMVIFVAAAVVGLLVGGVGHALGDATLRTAGSIGALAMTVGCLGIMMAWREAQ